MSSTINETAVKHANARMRQRLASLSLGQFAHQNQKKKYNCTLQRANR